MASLIEGYNYDVFISYRQKDNKQDGWVTELVNQLKGELESTFKEDINVYFDINPHNGLLETHDVDASLKEKLKCLVFIPIISRTYCDPKSFAWEHEFKPFVEQASKDQFGLKVKLPGGNVANRVLPIRIHDLNNTDIKEFESALGGLLRGVEFIYKEPGVNRPLTTKDNEEKNINQTKYRNQINKVALAIREIILGLKKQPTESAPESKESVFEDDRPIINEKSIVVLPFDDLSPNHDQEYFSDGLTEEIISDLSFVRSLKVISRSSAMTFKGTKKKIPDIAREVNVQFVLEGSVRKSSNNLRINAQLIDAKRDVHVWADRYSGTSDDIFDIQEKVALSIVKALEVELTAEVTQKLRTRSIENLTAYEYYLKAYREIWRFTENSLERALEYLDKGIEVLGTNVYLLAAQAYAYLLRGSLDIKPVENWRRAEETARKALTLDPAFPKALAVLGWLEYWHERQQAGVKYFKEALAIDPNEFSALHGLTATYFWMGKLEVGLECAERLIQLDPLNPFGLNVKGGLLWQMGLREDAMQWYEKAFSLDRENPAIHMHYVWALAGYGQIEKAIAIAELSSRATPNNPMSRMAILVKYAITNDAEGIHQVLNNDFVATCRSSRSYSMLIADIFARLGNKGEAYIWLEHSVDLGLSNYPRLLNGDPFLDSLRNEERFKKLLEKVKSEWENFEV